MNLQDYAELVQQMRAEQKRYFALRRNSQARQDAIDKTLSLARELERRVDRATDDVLNRQGKLF